MVSCHGSLFGRLISLLVTNNPYVSWYPHNLRVLPLHSQVNHVPRLGNLMELLIGYGTLESHNEIIDITLLSLVNTTSSTLKKHRNITIRHNGIPNAKTHSNSKLGEGRCRATGLLDGRKKQSLRGKQLAWYKDVKEQVFGDNEDITVKRIGEKVQNMKIAWRNARKIQEQSGEGLRSEDNAPTFNALLESKCPLFWRLDEIVQMLHLSMS
ncbi:hypothetical protein L211DRAFT_692041 [Terfezia boudieri ATCC MYA-4762]|uniref:Uncharacterized protein n=1 Tax=Terfezia boudieri ATCC MYA-4762 TaxID=1051890 RepID=A0A3N4LB78_9PEZI|nr:hypothetical protein L211DRAFT_692041 [Terfezia boudieri ATCC MYA-4762]